MRGLAAASFGLLRMGFLAPLASTHALSSSLPATPIDALALA